MLVHSTCVFASNR